MARPQRPQSQKYPDTPTGVRDMLVDESSLPRGYIDRAAIYPDPQVEGVWKLEWEEPYHDNVAECIAYLAGYKDPWGDVREDNDFECGYDFGDDVDPDAPDFVYPDDDEGPPPGY